MPLGVVYSLVEPTTITGAGPARSGRQPRQAALRIMVDRGVAFHGRVTRALDGPVAGLLEQHRAEPSPQMALTIGGRTSVEERRVSARSKKPVATAHTAEGAATAPILLFDEVPVFGLHEGLGRLTLSAYIQDLTPDGQPTMRKVVVAHLRGNSSAFRMLRQALDGIDHLSAGGPPPRESKN